MPGFTSLSNRIRGTGGSIFKVRNGISTFNTSFFRSAIHSTSWNGFDSNTNIVRKIVFFINTFTTSGMIRVFSTKVYYSGTGVSVLNPNVTFLTDRTQ